MNHTHIGCYAIIRNRNSMAVIKKARGPYTGLLDLPGGTPDFGESPEETVIREVKEEVGLEVTKAVLLYCDSTVYKYRKNGDHHQLHHIGMIFRCEVSRLVLSESGDGLDSNGGIWLPILDTKTNLITPFVAHALSYLQHAQRERVE